MRFFLPARWPILGPSTVVLLLFGSAVAAIAREGASGPAHQQNSSDSSQLSTSASPVPPAISPVSSSVEVRANDTPTPIDLTVHESYRGEIQSSAGTYGDFSRYLQLMPGVTWTSDQSNEILVRGGHPTENLYVVDGIEIPNVNHLAVEGTSGGFSSMIDTSTIDKVDLQTGAYDAKYSSRLSSLVEIHTRDQGKAHRAGEVNFGIAGIGGFWEQPLGKKGSLLLSAHRSLLNVVTQNAGLNGVPIYTDGMARLEWSPRQKDRISVLSLNGADSIDISPCAADPFESLTFNTQYGGSRSTTGLVWQHIHDPSTVSNLTLSYSTQSQGIDQQDQYANGAFAWGPDKVNCQATAVTSVYGEKSLDRFASVGYNIQRNIHSWFISAGETNRVVKLNYAVGQSFGERSPFNINPEWSDSHSFNHNPLTVETGTFAEATGSFARRWTMTAGLRMETYGLPNAHILQPRVSLAYRIGAHHPLNAAYRRSSQLAPYMDLLSYAGNRNLRPIEVQQFSLGADLLRMSWGSVSVEGYRKLYTNEPVSTEYSGLMPANMVDSLGQQFIWLPLRTGGKGNASGVELMARGQISNLVSLLAAGSYSRTEYAAADGVMRRANADLPRVGNAMATARLPWRFEFSLRDSYVSGHPYTPYNVPLSLAEQRGIYDLDHVNSKRGPAYNRLDLSINRDIHIRQGVLNLYGGVQNAFNRKNFLGFVWLDRCSSIPICVEDFNGVPMIEVNQMPVFPSAGIRYSF